MDYSPVVIQLRKHLRAFYSAANSGDIQLAKQIAHEINQLSMDLLFVMRGYK